MPSYRIYCLKGAGHISFADVVEAADDAEAVEKAREKNNGAIKCEVWDGKRLVATLNVHDLAD